MISAKRLFAVVTWCTAACLVLAAGPLRAQEADSLATLAADVASDDAAMRLAAFEKLVALGGEAVDGLLDMLVEPGEGDDAGARYALHGMAMRAGRAGAEERAEFATALSAYLAGDSLAGVKQFVIGQLQIAGAGESVPALVACLTEAELVDHACRALIVNPSPDVDAALREALPKAEAGLRVPIIQALGARRDAGAVSMLLEQAANENADVRVAAITALGRIGDPSAETAIAEAVGRDDERESRAAFDAYLHLGEQMQKDGHRAEAAGVYGGALETALTGASRSAALLGIGRAGSGKDSGTLLAYLGDPDPMISQAVRQSLEQLRGPGIVGALAKAMKGAEPSAKTAVLQVLAERKEPEAAQVLRMATKDDSAEVRVTACHLLDRLDDPSLEPTLLTAANTGSDIVHPVALEAYMRLAEVKAQDGRASAARSMYGRALDAARTDALCGMALRGLATVPSSESLLELQPFLQSEALRGDALRAYVAIGKSIADAGHEEQAIRMLQRALAMGPPPDAAQAAADTLRELGIQIDVARSGGFVTAWWFLGPFPGESIGDKLPPEDGVDLGATVKSGESELRWTSHNTADASGIVNLAKLMTPSQRVAAYLYAEVTVEAAQDVLLKTGSDDGMKCWLNGKVVHAYANPRSLTVDEDSVEAQLAAGVNRILVKVANGGGGWVCCLRITDRDGRPLAFEQREE
jgi:HEAT repeat protein